MAATKKVLFLEGYFGGSHRAFAEGWRRRSRHRIEIASLPARKWKWRMQTGAWLMADRGRLPMAPQDADVVFATDMINLAEFLGLMRRELSATPSVLYFHENQYSYPEQVDGGSDFTWGAINCASALAADVVVFNSEFHKRDFFENWRRGLRRMPDAALAPERIDALEEDSRVVPVGVDLAYFDGFAGRAAKPATDDPPLILWNHRWEHDKGPEAFFEALGRVRDAGARFRLAVCGQRFADAPPCFEEARRRFAPQIDTWGFLLERADYARLLWRADISVSCAHQEFLGLAAIEAMWCGCYPLLPRRLNYPWLLPAERHAAHLYDGQTDLADRLLEVLTDDARPREKWPARADFLRPYGWDEVTARLDALIDEASG